MKLLFAALAIAGCAAAQNPWGWRVVKDRAGTCQFAVPADWTSNKLVPSIVTGPDGANGAIHSVKGQTFAQAVANAKQVMTPVKVIEDSAARSWYTYANASGKPGTNWYIAVSATPPCAAQVTFKDSAFEETAKKIVMSIGPAK